MGIYVDVDLDEFDEQEIVEYLQGLGYSVKDNSPFDTEDEQEIVEYLQGLGYSVKDNSPFDTEDEEECEQRLALMELYRQYRTKDARLMDTLREYLSETLGKVM